MNWITLSLLSHLSWAFGNIGDKFIVTNSVKNPYIYAIWCFLVGIIAVAIIPFIDFQIPNATQFLWILLAVAIEFSAMFPYIKAMQIEEVTRINIWWTLIPLFSLLIAYVTIGEGLSQNQAIAFVMLVFGTVLASVKFKRNLIKFSKAFWLMALSCLCFAVYATIIRHITQEIPFLDVFIWTHIIGLGLALMPFLFKKVREINSLELKDFNFKKAITIFSVVMTGLIGTWLNVWALSVGKVALVYAMEGFQSIFVFILTILFALFTTINLREELDKKTVILKIFAIIINLGGIVMLNV